MQNVVEMKGITKIFPGVIANENVDFQLREGEIHVLLGENGAGKTTLMNVLYGLYQQEAGEVYIKGQKADMKSPSDAIKLGIGMVHQHFMLVPNFSIAQNIILGSEPKKGLTINMKKAEKDVDELQAKYGFNLKPKDLIQDITVGQQQKVEILKALYRGVDILILDEPTAVLTPQEIEELGVILRNLVKEGKSIILITHKLKEIMAMSDRVTIVRRGKVIDTVNTKDTNIDHLAELMVGRKVNLVVDKDECKPKETILKVSGLKALDNRSLPVLKGIDLEVKAGEIVGIAGVDGNGQSEFIEVLTGLRQATEGKVELKGKDITNKAPRDIIESGLCNVPEDRHKRGLVLKHSLVENSILGQHYKAPFSKGIMIDYSAVREHAVKLIEEFDVRTPNEDALAVGLSGGNQQKLIVGREIMKDPELLIAAQPTRGLDVGAIEYIHKRLIGERDKGKAVLLVSLELDEVMNVSDRIAVMYDGEIVGILDAKTATENELGILMAGGQLKEK
ncbi:ABC transporter ATP-binding protein [Inconstantimicrobium mannanitabidum]|uniref:Sugar ABC transporter ATP-binding protein n=1 Tax=Inconstantimicrobium mannanitabidum TaxID=1604901 RepID=A0ACB5RF50_9CLOT|nr:ABC transporter ATP-binding protein [Clostridium sp. TW13]GKX67723.1 sugar ABC transporter ATP-binding protein [Clostridium sp. TW13]